MKKNGKKYGWVGVILVIVIYILLVKAGVIQLNGAENSGAHNAVENNTPVPITTEAPTKAPEATKAPEETQAPTEAPEITEAPTEEPEVELTNYWFRTKALRDSHFEKHGIEMGFETPEDYIKAANMVICNPDALHKLEAEDNDHVYFLEETNEFVVLSQDGYIRTYYIANGGIDYFNRQ